MAVALRETNQCVDFFQQTILRAVSQWRESKAVQQVDVPVLDRNRLTILNIINRGLEYQPSWPELKELMFGFASYMERRGHWEVWRDVLDASIEVAQSLNDVDGEITLTALFARLSQRQSRGDDVVRYYRRVIRLARKSGNQFELARACSNLGYFYIDRGHWWRSEVLSCHALALFEALGSEHGRAHTHNHLGVLYNQQNLWEPAEEHYKHACRMWEGIGDTHSLIYGYENLGILNVELGRLNDARNYLQKAMEHIDASGDNSEVGNALANMAYIFRLEGDWKNAERHARNAETTFKSIKNMYGLGQIWHELGLIYLSQDDQNTADYYLQKSLLTHKQLNNYDNRIRVHLDVIEIYVTKKDFPRAIRELDALKNLLTRYRGKQKQKYIEQMEIYNQNLLTCMVN